MTIGEAFWWATKRWEDECKEELKARGYKAGNWEFCVNGGIQNRKVPSKYIPDMVTPWRESRYYVELDISDIDKILC